jgi:hypothetical protein
MLNALNRRPLLECLSLDNSTLQSLSSGTCHVYASISVSLYHRLLIEKTGKRNVSAMRMRHEDARPGASTQPADCAR